MACCTCDWQAELLDNVALNLHRIDKDVQRCDRNYCYFTTTNLDKLRNVMCTYVFIYRYHALITDHDTMHLYILSTILLHSYHTAKVISQPPMLRNISGWHGVWYENGHPINFIRKMKRPDVQYPREWVGWWICSGILLKSHCVGKPVPVGKPPNTPPSFHLRNTHLPIPPSRTVNAKLFNVGLSNLCAV